MVETRFVPEQIPLRLCGVVVSPPSPLSVEDVRKDKSTDMPAEPPFDFESCSQDLFLGLNAKATVLYIQKEAGTPGPAVFQGVLIAPRPPRFR